MSGDSLAGGTDRLDFNAASREVDEHRQKWLAAADEQAHRFLRCHDDEKEAKEYPYREALDLARAVRAMVRWLRDA